MGFMLLLFLFCLFLVFFSFLLFFFGGGGRGEGSGTGRDSLPVNPFTAPACKTSGLKDARTSLQTIYFPVV